MIKTKIINNKITNLNIPIKNKGGRSRGKITTQRRGNPFKKIYRVIDFQRLIHPLEESVAIFKAYDPNRNAPLMVMCFPIGLISYILLPSHLNIGDTIINQTNKPTKYGDATSLRLFPSGVMVHNIAGKFVRSAGCSSICIRKDQDQALLKLKSGELRFFHISTLATFGTLSNENHFLKNLKKAGASRSLGIRPRNRPCSRNPVDHPMGGRTRGKQSKNPKGKMDRNVSTKKYKNIDIIITARKKNLLK